MNDSEIADFSVRLNNLFPGKVNDSTMEIWVSRVRKLSISDALSSLNNLVAGDFAPKYSDGPRPSLAAFMRIARGTKSEKPATGAAKVDGYDWRETIRQGWIKSSPQAFAELSRMTLDEIELRFRRDDFMTGLMTLGVESGIVHRGFYEWQKVAARIGHEVLPWDAPQWQSYIDERTPRRAAPMASL